MAAVGQERIKGRSGSTEVGGKREGNASSRRLQASMASSTRTHLA